MKWKNYGLIFAAFFILGFLASPFWFRSEYEDLDYPRFTLFKLAVMVGIWIGLYKMEIRGKHWRDVNVETKIKTQ